MTAEKFTTVAINWDSDSISYPDMAEAFAQRGVDITPQSIAENAQVAEQFMKTLVEKAIAETSRLSRDPHKSVAIPGVNAIFLADASSQALHRGLAEAFPGTGGSGPVASVKVNLLFNYTEQKVCDLEVTSGKTSDHELSERYRALMKPGNLLLHDLGYFDTKHFIELDAQGVFYLSRIPAAVTHFFHPDESEFNIWDMLGKSRHLSHDFDLYVGADRNLIGRVVAIRLPRSEWQKRINAAQPFRHE